GHDGLPPADLVDIGRTEVASYGAEIIHDRVVDVTGDDREGFGVVLAGGGCLVARRVVVATGLVDELPDIEGLAERWGRDVIHCPFCHGYEARDQRIVQIVTSAVGQHQALLFRQLTDDLTVVLHDDTEMTSEARAELAADQIEIHDTSVSRIVIDDDTLCGVELDDGTILEASVVVVGPTFRARTAPLAGLDLDSVPHPSGLGDHLPVDDMGRTTVSGVYAAGNVTDPSQQVLHAAAAGSRVGAMVAADLAHVDHEQRRTLAAAGDHSFDRDYWERHWSSRRSGDDGPPPNPYLGRELASLAPGTALDAGCGAGSEAIWLAEAGWQVVAADISTDALDLARRRSSGHPAAERVHWLEADLTEWQPAASFDLVVTSYAHPATGQLDFYERLQHWVAPGGTLLIVGHNHAHGHDEDGTGHEHPPEHATTTATAIAGILDPGEWTVESAYETTRTVARGDGHVPLHDVVVRASRRT
ncbi:MAG: methyltransferase domain-containing protein, partial [Acidimicrobiia bacterium]